MRWRVPLIFASGWLLTASFSAAPAQENTHQSEYLKIYLKINDADQLERNGDFRGALADFKDCYARLQKIHNSDPNWESALVIHRMADCQAKIRELADKAAQQMGEPATNPEPAINNNPTPSVAPLSEDVAALKLRLGEVEQELQDTKAKLQNSQIEASTLRSQLDSVNQQLADLKNGQSEDEKMGKLLTQNKVLTDKLAAAQKEIATIKNPTGKTGLALMRSQLKNTQDKLDASEAANTALQQTTDTLRQQLDQAQSDLRSANQRLAAAPPSSPEYDTLKRENEVMREILTRELQEQAHRDMAKRLAQEEFDRMKITSRVLQEQLDILGSPMTPPTTDQERALLDSLKTPLAQVSPMPDSGNGFSATAPPTNAAPAAITNSDSSPTTPPPTTSDNGIPAPTNATPSAPSTPLETASTPTTTTNAPDNSQPPVTVVTPPTTPPTSTTPDTVTPATAPDTNMASNPTPPPSTPTPVPDNSNTNSVATTPAPDTNTPPTNPSITATTNAETTPAAPDTNTPPANTPPAVATTTYTDTTITQHDTNAPAAQQPPSDNTEYSSKPRLPDDMRDTAQQAADLFKMQRYDEAAAKYQSIIDKYPESLYAWSNLGVVRFQQGKLPEALKALQQAVKLSPTDAFSYSNLGIVYYQMGQYENAISALERALALDPNNAKSHNYLGCACSQKGWQEVAEKEFLKAIELDDTFGDAHFNLALVYATEKPPSLEMARRHYKRALELGIAQDPRLEKLLQMDGSQYPQASAQK